MKVDVQLIFVEKMRVAASTLRREVVAKPMRAKAVVKAAIEEKMFVSSCMHLGLLEIAKRLDWEEQHCLVGRTMVQTIFATGEKLGVSVWLVNREAAVHVEMPKGLALPQI
jgi:hypothetical protein